MNVSIASAYPAGPASAQPDRPKVETPGSGGRTSADGHRKAVAERADSCHETAGAARVADRQFARRVGRVGEQHSGYRGADAGSGSCDQGRNRSSEASARREELTFSTPAHPLRDDG